MYIHGYRAHSILVSIISVLHEDKACRLILGDLIKADTTRDNSRFRFDRLEFSDVVARNVALLPGPFALGEPPVALGVVDYLQVLSFSEAQIFVRASVVVVESDEYLCGSDIRVRNLRNRPDGIRRGRRYRINLRRDRLDGIDDPVRVILLHDRIAATVPHA